MGRAPCCDKANVKKGPWSPEEDAKLKSYIEQHGTGGNWIALPQKIGLKRCGKSCRLRWLNYLRPNIKHGGFSEEEDNIICSLYVSIGSRWSIIAAQLPGRTDNDIKNYWNTRLKKKLLGKQRKEQQARRGNAIKQELKKGNSGSLMPDHYNNQNPYWPELPVLAPIPYSNQEPRFNDHASIRKLLIKLGGRFSCEDQVVQHDPTNLQFPIGISCTQHIYEQSISLPTSSSSMDGINNISAQFGHTHYSTDGAAALQVFQAQNSFPVELQEIVYTNQQRVDGMEFLHADGMLNNRLLGTSRSEISSWGDLGSLACPPFASDYEGMQQEILQDCAFSDQLRYPGFL